MAGKQAKFINPREVTQILDLIQKTRYPFRNEVMFLLSVKAGLRSKEICNLQWSMVTNASGELIDFLKMPDNATKGKSGRTIPLNSMLKSSIARLRTLGDSLPHEYLIKSERGHKMCADSVCLALKNIYLALRLDGCSSHSGRVTFINNAMCAITKAGGHVDDVRELAGHASLNTTMKYLRGNTEAKIKVVDMI